MLHFGEAVWFGVAVGLEWLLHAVVTLPAFIEPL
jgi:hypothetical protein